MLIEALYGISSVILTTTAIYDIDGGGYIFLLAPICNTLARRVLHCRRRSGVVTFAGYISRLTHSLRRMLSDIHIRWTSAKAFDPTSADLFVTLISRPVSHAYEIVRPIRDKQLFIIRCGNIR